MNHESYVSLTAIIFVAIVVLHALRLFYGWQVVIGAWSVPTWLSWLAVVVAGYLSWRGFKLIAWL